MEASHTMAKCIRVGMKDGLGQSMAAGEVGACEIIVDSRSLTYGIWCRITLAYHPIYYTPTRSEVVYLLHTIILHTYNYVHVWCAPEGLLLDRNFSGRIFYCLNHAQFCACAGEQRMLMGTQGVV